MIYLFFVLVLYLPSGTVTQDATTTTAPTAAPTVTPSPTTDAPTTIVPSTEAPTTTNASTPSPSTTSPPTTSAPTDTSTPTPPTPTPSNSTVGNGTSSNETIANNTGNVSMGTSGPMPGNNGTNQGNNTTTNGTSSPGSNNTNTPSNTSFTIPPSPTTGYYVGRNSYPLLRVTVATSLLEYNETKLRIEIANVVVSSKFPVSNLLVLKREYASNGSLVAYPLNATNTIGISISTPTLIRVWLVFNQPVGAEFAFNLSRSVAQSSDTGFRDRVNITTISVMDSNGNDLLSSLTPTPAPTPSGGGEVSEEPSSETGFFDDQTNIIVIAAVAGGIGIVGV
eukprot:PhF_6_TR25456/c0_g1_i3/m.35234